MPIMGRIPLLLVVVVWIASASGCSGLAGWYRSAGDLPGVAPTDYAYYDFFGTSSQLYPASPGQLESSAVEALGDMGFLLEEPPAHLPNGESMIRAKTPDGRPATLTITPQNSLTNVRVKIGPDHIGDYGLSHDLLRRIALNFGKVMRAYTPIDTTLPKRINASRFKPEGTSTVLFELQGDGLRPNESRDKAARDEAVPPEQDATQTPNNLPALLQGILMQGGMGPSPYLPYPPLPMPPNNQDAP
jgi:hypothetical protein